MQHTWRTMNNYSGVSPFPPSHGFWAANSGCQAWVPVFLPAEPFHHPFSFIYREENRNGGLWKINLPLLIQLTMGNAGIQPLKGTNQNLLSYFFILSTWPGASGSGSNT